MHLVKRLAILSVSCMAFGLTGKPSGADRSLPKVAGETPRNIIFILADDHRFDAMGFAASVFGNPKSESYGEGGRLVSERFCDPPLFAQPRQHCHRAVRAQSQRG